jgi:hypothetical protein
VTRVVHLIAHDVRAHRSLLLAWALIVVLHPCLALRVGDGTGGAMPVWFGVLLVAARLTVGMIVLGVVFQADSPLDDRAFWRTRPIAPGEMATAKLGLAALLFVLLPLLVVVAVASAVNVAWSHWPSTLAQVVYTDAALAGLTMALATKTRSVPALVLALLVCVIGVYLMLIIVMETRRVPARVELDAALPTMGLCASAGLWTAAAIGFAGRRRDGRFACTAALTLALIFAAWFVPQMRVHGRGQVLQTEPFVSATVLPDSIRAEQLAVPDAIGIVATPRYDGVQPGDRVQAFLLDGRIVAPGIDLAARRDRDPRSAVPDISAPRVPLLAVLTRPDFSRLAGRSVRFTGRLNVDVQRIRVVARAPLAVGSVLSADGSRLAIAEILATSQDAPQIVARGATLDMYLPGRWRARRREYRLRDERSGCVARLFLQSSPSMEMATLTLLPTLARPFTVRRGNLAILDADGCRPSQTTPVVEMVDVLTLVRPVDVAVNFTMPVSATSMRVPDSVPPLSRER